MPRVATINIHQSIPGHKPLGDRHEDVRVLEDVARYIRSVDADVVVVQEIDDDRGRPGKVGVADQFSRLRELSDVTDAAFTPAFDEANGDRYGTAIFTRNGYRLGKVHNMDLPNPRMAEDRAAAISAVTAPDGTGFTMVHTHLAASLDPMSDRPLQLRTLSQQLRELVRDGSVGYHDAVTGQQGVVTGLDTTRMVVAGDMNTFADVADGHFWQAGLRNVMSEPDIVADPDRRERAQQGSFFGPGGVRIDHVYVSDAVQVQDTWVDELPAKAVPDGPVSDHSAVVADLGFAPAKNV